MRSRLFFAFGLAIIAAGACATSDHVFDTIDGGSGATTGGGASSMSSAEGTATASTGSLASGSSSASGTSSASGSMCTESPCKLVAPQCGCGAGEQCSLDLSDGSRICVPEGDVAWRELCPSGATCEPGNLCVKTAGVGLCAKLCDDDGQCGGPGGLCIRTLTDANGGAIEGATLCTEACDPATNSGCPAAGTSCQVDREDAGQMRFFTSCLASGAGTQGASCATNKDCAATYGCFNDGVSDMCLKYCKINAPICPAGTSCTSKPLGLDPVIVGNEQYGACS